MKQRIDLHDSHIKEVLGNEIKLEITFDSLVILDVTDDFGFEFSRTSYRPGIISVSEPIYKTVPTRGTISGGYIAVGDCQYHIIPPDFDSAERALLFIEQNENSHMIFGKEIFVTLL